MVGAGDLYCGPAPQPDQLLYAWNPDPYAAALCLSILMLHRKTAGGPEGGSAGFLWAGLLTLAILFLSPLCALASALFSARVVHHVLLVALVAPLLAAAFPERRRSRIPLAWLTGLHAAMLWLWHAPDIYGPAIMDPALYWAMQLSLLGSAFLLWRAILSRRTTPGAALLALLATIIQMGLLGALLTFLRVPLYPPHFLSTAAFGLTPLEDQQLGGLIMWVPAALPYLAVAILRLLELLEPARPVPASAKPS